MLIEKKAQPHVPLFELLILALGLYVFSIFFFSPGPLYAGTTGPMPEGEVEVEVDQVLQDWDKPVQLLDNRIYLPTRDLVSSLGGQVDYRHQDKTFHIAYGQTRLEMDLLGKKALVNGQDKEVSQPPLLLAGVSYLPLRYIAETLGYEVFWQGEEKRVQLKSKKSSAVAPLRPQVFQAEKLTILGPPIISLADMKTWFSENIQGYSQLPDLYYRLAAPYGIRPDLAIAQMLKETGHLRYGNLVQPEQNNFCGLYATGQRLRGDESLNGADQASVRLVKGQHGASFSTMAAGVEAHLQHLYAYAIDHELPPGVRLLDPRFSLLPSFSRGSSPYVAYLGKEENPQGIGWATDGRYGYGITAVLQALYDDILEKDRP